MKKLAFVFLALCALTLPAHALTLPQELDGAVPDELLTLAEGDGDNLVTGGASYLLEQLRLALRALLFPSLRSLAALLLLALVCGLLESTADAAGENGARSATYLGVLGAALLSAGEVRSLLSLGVETVDSLHTMAKLLLPTVASAMAAGGAAGTASVWQVGALLLSDLFLAALQGALVPLLYGMLAVATAGALLEEERLSRLADGLGALTSLLLRGLLLAFTAFLSLSDLLAGSADRLAVQLGKTVVSGAVPIVGGILSDAADSLLAGAHALRAVLGTLGVLAVLGVCVAPLARLAVQYALYRVAAFFCGMVGSRALRGYLDRLSEVFALILAMTAGGAFLLLVSLLISLLMVVTV